MLKYVDTVRKLWSRIESVGFGMTFLGGPMGDREVPGVVPRGSRGLEVATRTSDPTPSERAYPLARASNVLHRPSAESMPAAAASSVKDGCSLSAVDIEMAVACSSMVSHICMHAPSSTTLQVLTVVASTVVLRTHRSL